MTDTASAAHHDAAQDAATPVYHSVKTTSSTSQQAAQTPSPTSNGYATHATNPRPDRNRQQVGPEPKPHAAVSADATATSSNTQEGRHDHHRHPPRHRRRPAIPQPGSPLPTSLTMTITAAEHARRNIIAANTTLRDARQRTDLTPEDQALEIDLANERLNDALDAWQALAPQPTADV